MASRCLGDLLQELSDLLCLLQQRRASRAPDSLLEKLVKSGKARIAAEAPLSIADATKLYSLLKKAAGSQTDKQQLQEAVDEALSQGPGAAATTRESVDKSSLKTQLLLCPQNYLTESDWRVLEDPSSSEDAKLKTLAVRLRSVGCRSLAEKTAGACVALLCALLPQLPPYQEIFEMVLDFKKAFGLTSGQGQEALPFLRVYPADAADLPQALREHGYAREAACPKHVEALQSIMTYHMPLRPTSKLLVGSLHVATPQRGSAASTWARHSPGRSKAVSEDDPLTLRHFLMGCRMMGLAASENAHTHPDSTSTVRLTPAGRNSGAEKQLLALPAPPENSAGAGHSHAGVPVNLTRTRAGEEAPATEPLQPKVRAPAEVSTSANQPASEPALTDLEQKAYEKLQAKALEKKTLGTGSRGRGSGRGRGRGKGRGRGRTEPAKGSQDARSPGKGAAAKTRKRPAAAISSARPWLVQKPTAKQRGSSKESYFSTQYHQAKQHALRELGCEEEEAKEHGRRAYNEAKALW